jgi:ATP-dependent RNA helicase DeaD
METSELETTTVHYFREVSGELLAKPDALAEIIDANRGEKIIVFCNTPSDVDMIEALLRKRGINSRKLIGHVPPAKVSAAIQDIKNGDASALIVTDVAGQNIDLGNFDLSVNYTMHSDPEIYLQRTGQLGGAAPKKAVSLIGPLDITHFHYLKKVAGFDFQQLEAPSEEDILAARLNSIKQVASNKEIPQRTKTIAEKIMKDSDAENIVAFLLQNYFEPPATPVVERYSNGQEDEGGRRGRNRSGRDEQRDEQREEKRERTPVKKEARVYIGIGTKQEFSEEALKKLIEEVSPEHKDAIKRFSGREEYSFFDLDEEIADLVVSKLENAEWKGKKLFVKEAIRIPLLRQEIQEIEEKKEDSEESTEEEDIQPEA